MTEVIAAEDPAPMSKMEERCQELIVVARQWEEQMSDLRSFTQIEKESLESEIASLQEMDKVNEQEKSSLENSLMVLEDERVRSCALNDLSVQSKIETEVKLQLMESALEAVSLQSMVDTQRGPVKKTVECATDTDDLSPSLQISASQPEETTTNITQEAFSTRNSDMDAENLALQLEVRKLRHQLIVSQISAKQFKSECQLYKSKSNNSTTRTLNKKKRKDITLTSDFPLGPSKQSARRTPALSNIENRVVQPA